MSVYIKEINVIFLISTQKCQFYIDYGAKYYSYIFWLWKDIENVKYLIVQQ